MTQGVTLGGREETSPLLLPDILIVEGLNVLEPGQLPKDGPDCLESVLLRLEEMDGKPSRSIPIRAGDGWNAPTRETVTLPE